jgi:hypothetical protein
LSPILVRLPVTTSTEFYSKLLFWLWSFVKKRLHRNVKRWVLSTVTAALHMSHAGWSRTAVPFNRDPSVWTVSNYCPFFVQDSEMVKKILLTVRHRGKTDINRNHNYRWIEGSGLEINKFVTYWSDEKMSAVQFWVNVMILVTLSLLCYIANVADMY